MRQARLDSVPGAVSITRSASPDGADERRQVTVLGGFVPKLGCKLRLNRKFLQNLQCIFKS